MGLLRTLLALSVLNAHLSHGLPILRDGRLAVELFFLISGFYMHMVWQDKYSSLPVRNFYISRALRIYPIYFVVLVLTLALAYCGLLTGHGPVQLIALRAFPLNTMGDVIVLFPQLVIFGSEALTLIYREAGGDIAFGYAEHFAKYMSSSPNIINYIFIPQGWSLSLELMFYLLVPFVIRRIKWMVAFFALSMILRIGMAICDLNYAPWNFHFFPLELAFFLAGAMSHSIHQRLNVALRVDTKRWLKYSYCAIFFALVIFFPQFQATYGEAAYWLTYAIAIVALPILFGLTKSSKFDRNVGELSYPIYAVHYLMIFAAAALGIASNSQFAFVLVTTLLSGVMLKVFQEWVDKFRANLGSH